MVSVYDFLGYSFKVVANEIAIHSYYKSFYNEVDQLTNDDFTILFKSDFKATISNSNCSLDLSSDSEFGILIQTRKAIRSLIITKAIEKDSFCILHACSFQIGSNIYILLGDKNAGKTTLLFDGIFNHGAKLIGNDHLIIHRIGSKFEILNIPTYIPIKPWTAKRFLLHLQKIINQSDYMLIESMPELDSVESPLKIFVKLSELSNITSPSSIISKDMNISFIFPKFNNFGKEKVTLEVIEPSKLDKRLDKNLRTDWITENILHLEMLDEIENSQKNVLKDFLSHVRNQLSIFTYQHEGNISHLIET